MHLAITLFYSSRSRRWVAFYYLIKSKEGKMEGSTFVAYAWVEISWDGKQTHKQERQ